MQKAASVFDIMAQVAEVKQIVNTPRSQVFMMAIDGCAKITTCANPGQFVMIWPEPESIVHILGRPFAIAFCHPSIGRIQIIFRVVGWGTNELAGKRPGDLVKVRGPLGGNGWRINSDATEALLVAGGTGIAAFISLIEVCRQSEDIRKIYLFIGAKTAAELVLPTEIAKCRYVEISVATEDGTAGLHGFVTDALQKFLYSNPLQEPQIFAAGPRPMLKVVAEISRRNGISGQVAMETNMACGLGACYGCATAVYDQESPVGWNYERVCKDGPVFPAEKIVWRWKKMRLKMRGAGLKAMDEFADKAAFATGFDIAWNTHGDVSILCPDGTEEATLQLLKEKIGLEEADYTRL